MESKKTLWLLILIFVAVIANCVLLIFYGNKLLSTSSDEQNLDSQNVVENNISSSDIKISSCCENADSTRYNRCELYGTENSDGTWGGQKSLVCENSSEYDGPRYERCERNLGACSCPSKSECEW